MKTVRNVVAPQPTYNVCVRVDGLQPDKKTSSDQASQVEIDSPQKMPRYSVWVQLRLAREPENINTRWRRLPISAFATTGQEVYLGVARASWLPRRGCGYALFYYEKCEGAAPWPEDARMGLADRILDGTRLVLVHNVPQGVSYVDSDNEMGSLRSSPRSSVESAIPRDSASAPTQDGSSRDQGRRVHLDEEHSDQQYRQHPCLSAAGLPSSGWQ